MSAGVNDSPGRPPADEHGDEHGLARSLVADPRFGPLPALALATALLAVAAAGVTRRPSGAASWRAFPAGKS